MERSPIHYLRELAESISQQNKEGACEWVVLDNGCSNKKLLGYLNGVERVAMGETGADKDESGYYTQGCDAAWNARRADM